MSGSIKRNLGLQTIYTAINSCIPLITAPYLSRVLGVANLGIFSHTTSIVSYFSLLAMLGTVNYGTRTIASVKDSKEERSKCFIGIYILQFSFSLFSMSAYLLYLVFICRENVLIAIIQGITIINCFGDITWLYIGMEKININVGVSLVFRILTVISILVFVNQPDDLWKYTCIMLIGTFCSHFSLWLFLPRYVCFQKITHKDIFKHLKPNLVLFIPIMTMSVYHTMDKTMLGYISDYDQSGLYYNADKVINIPIGVIRGIGTVMLPRMSSVYSNGDYGSGDSLFLTLVECVVYISIAMCIGISVISDDFVTIFFGKGFEGCVILIIALSPVLIIKGYTIISINQYLVPLKLERFFIGSVIAGAITNLIVNIILIPRLNALGAVIGTVMAELVSCVWITIFIQKRLELRKCLLRCLPYFLLGAIMGIVVFYVKLIPIPVIYKVVLEILVGAVVYIGEGIVFWKITKNKIFDIIFKNKTTIVNRLFQKK